MKRPNRKTKINDAYTSFISSLIMLGFEQSQNYISGRPYIMDNPDYKYTSVYVYNHRAIIRTKHSTNYHINLDLQECLQVLDKIQNGESIDTTTQFTRYKGKFRPIKYAKV